VITQYIQNIEETTIDEPSDLLAGSKEKKHIPNTDFQREIG
jgi:hypothetical protein